MAPRPQGRGRAPGSRFRPARGKRDGTSSSSPPGTAAEGLRILFEEAARVPKPSPEERARLLRRAGAGDEGARDTLLKTNLALVGRLAAARLERGLPFGDLVQEGSIGLMGAIDYFEGSGRSDFDAFAEEQVAAQMEAALATEAEAVRDGEQLVEAAQRYEAAEMALARDLGRAPNNDELSKKLEWTPDRTRQIGELVSEARQRHDEELLQYLDPESLDEDEEEEEDG
jgi:RNA polymerase sigma factor (sigma-70 family)